MPTLTDLQAGVERYKFSPVDIQRTVLEHLDAVTDGKINLVDATSPFMFLLDASCVNTATAIQEYEINLRRQYPSLAQTELDLYSHMADVDYLDRFAKPSSVTYTLAISVSDIKSKLVRNDAEECYQATIARDTYFTVDEYTFTLEYPIDIRRFSNGAYQFSYNGELESPLGPLTNNIIDYVVRRDADGNDWVFLTVPLKQFKIETHYQTVLRSTPYEENIVFNDQYYYCRVFYKNENTPTWVEMKTTHSDQIFDPYHPTALLSVINNQVTVSVPMVYITTEQVYGNVRVDVYTTKGPIAVNMSNYKVNFFGYKLKAINEERDLNIYTAAMTEIGLLSFSDQITYGGSDQIEFLELRDRVIQNSIGDRQLPVTNAQATSYIENRGFELVKNVDVVTNRVFLAIKKLPIPNNLKLLTSANIGMSTTNMDLGYIRTLETATDNFNRITVHSNNLFINENGVVRIVTASELISLRGMSKTALAVEVNSKQYIYNPFYYVLDSSESEFDSRAYHLDQPFAKNLSFIYQNETMMLPVNTKTFSLTKTSVGYDLIISTKSGNQYKAVADNDITVVLGYVPVNETNAAFIKGIYLGRSDAASGNERIFKFEIKTNHDIDTDDYITLTSSKMFSTSEIKTKCLLSKSFKIYHMSSSITVGFKPSEADGDAPIFLTGPGFKVITHETLDLTFGYALKNLWSRSRTLPGGTVYKKHSTDIPLLYTEDVYRTDPVTGSIFTINTSGNVVYDKLHTAGDIVRDNSGAVIYKYKAGDTVIDADGNPVPDEIASMDKELDILFVDGRYYFTTDANFIAYRAEIAETIRTWITEDLKESQKKLLEQTKLFFYPKTTLGKVRVYPDSYTEDIVDAEQSLTIDLYVNNKVYHDNDIRNRLTSGIVKLVDEWIDDPVVNITELHKQITVFSSASVVSVSIKGLAGDKNYQILTLAQNESRLCVKKKLFVQPDGTTIIKEDITVNFTNVEKLAV
jgi:hypothetical protein